MLNKNKIKLLISSIVILLPMLAFLIMKEQIESGVRGSWYFGWILPIFLVIINLFLHLFTFRENERSGQNEKIVNFTYCMIPAISVYMSAIFFALSLGLEFNVSMVVSIIIGITLIISGNIMPKAVRNRYFGIKIKWTLANDDNWNATHRFAGKAWVVLGIVVLLSAFLPVTAAVVVWIASMVFMIGLTVGYSYMFYKKQIADGTATEADYTYHESEKDKKITKTGIVAGVIIVVIVGVLMFVGSISFTLGEEALEIDTTFGGGINIDYDDIDDVKFSDSAVDGMRVSGFASMKLLYGWFKNDTIGSYTRYTYTNSDCAIIIVVGEDTIVIADETPEKTLELFNALEEIRKGVG